MRWLLPAYHHHGVGKQEMANRYSFFVRDIASVFHAIMCKVQRCRSGERYSKKTRVKKSGLEEQHIFMSVSEIPVTVTLSLA